jgi:hypothetical protein
MKFLTIFGAIVLFLAGGVAQAHPHHHRGHHHMRVPLPEPRPTYSNNFFFNNWSQPHPWFQQQPQQQWFQPWTPAPQAPQVSTRPVKHGYVRHHHEEHEEHFEQEEHQTSFDRPGDCYGIAWCGCFLRHYFGLADRALNSAFEWTHIGQPTTPHNGAIVVWRHHVGLLRSDPVDGRALVLSGNDGHRVRLRAVSLGRAIAYRQM